MMRLPHKDALYEVSSTFSPDPHSVLYVFDCCRLGTINDVHVDVRCCTDNAGTSSGSSASSSSPSDPPLSTSELRGHSITHHVVTAAEQRHLTPVEGSDEDEDTSGVAAQVGRRLISPQTQSVATNMR